MKLKQNDTYLMALQEWYASNCDGDWEHEYGISIKNVDNPGWAVTIPLLNTRLEAAAFAPVERRLSSQNWIHCRVEGGSFIGDGGSRNLLDIVRTFIDWSNSGA